MWHAESSKEEWARRKTYLIRSLFEDVPMLSTISEGDESISQTSLNISGKPLLPQHLDTRRLSPLPDLIIEIIPRRLKQDEPEEFYRSLEKEMKKLYKRDYLNIYSTSSSEDIESVSNPEINDNYYDYDLHGECGNLGLAISKDGDDNFLEGEESEYDNSNETGEQRLSKTFVIANIERTSDSITLREDIEPHASIEKEITNEVRDSTYKDESIKSNKIQKESSKTFLLSPGFEENNETSIEKEITNEVRDSAYKDESIKSYKMQKESSKTFLLSPGFEENNETSDDEECEIMENEEPKKLAEKSGASSVNSDISSSIPEPEEIRRLEKRMSLISLPEHYFERFQEDSWEFQNKRLSMMIDQDVRDEVIASGKETQIAEESPDISVINITSTPKSIRKVNKNRYEPYSHASNSSKKQKCNQALQTSFSDEENFHDLWRNFFVGTPKFFRLI